MRALFIILTIASPFFSFSQNNIVKTIVADSGKYEFKRQAKRDTPDYSIAYRILENQAQQNPNNAEFRYFLGYVISRMDNSDGESMFLSNKEFTIKTSEQFEKVNELEPIYNGELFLLDPYSKISSIWGSLAAAYLNRGLIDSSKWAFAEGKKRGGFIQPILKFNKDLLSSCDKNAILLTDGDNTTFPCWYLQYVENFRTDVTVIDVNLLGCRWYPKYLKRQGKLKLAASDMKIDSYEYKEWKTKTITVFNPADSNQKFSWQMKPTYNSNYILRGNILLFDLIQSNYFSRPIYFYFMINNKKSDYLDTYLIKEGLAKRLRFDLKKESNTSSTIKNILFRYNIDSIDKNEILKSQDAIIVLNYYRKMYYSILDQLISKAQYDFAKKLVAYIRTEFNKQKLPYSSSIDEKNFENICNEVEDFKR